MLIKETIWLKSDKFTHLSTSGTQKDTGEFRVYSPTLLSWDTLGSFDGVGVPWSEGLRIEQDFIVTDAASPNTAIKWGFRKDAPSLIDEGYSVYLNAGKIGGTSWGPSGPYKDRNVLANQHYTLRYDFLEDGFVAASIQKGTSSFLGVRLMDTKITSGKIYWHTNVAGVSPNDSTGNMQTKFTKWTHE